LELLTGIKKKYKCWIEKQHHPRADIEYLYVPKKREEEN
jgi:hypothetical protein